MDDTVTNFPVCVELTASTFDFNAALSTGYDIRFTQTDDTLLKYERVSHDAVAQTAKYWVKLPNNKPFYMYYGNSGAADGADPEAVWDDNFVMVQHMNDATTSTITDSTQYDNDGAKKGANEPVEAVGKIGKAQDFDGNDDYIDCKTDSVNTNAVTISAWIYPTGWGGANQGRILDNGKTFLTVNNGDSGRLYFSSDGGNNIPVSATASVALDTWRHVTVTRTAAGVANFYVNGILSGTANQNSGTPVAGLRNVIIGGNTGDNVVFDGLIDEVRISNTLRSDAWVKAEYNAGNGTLLTMHHEVLVPIIKP
jgi:hypothetical protein